MLTTSHESSHCHKDHGELCVGTVLLLEKCSFDDASLCPQGLFPHIFSNWDSGIEPHHPTLHFGGYLHAEGNAATSQKEFEIKLCIILLFCLKLAGK